MSLLHLSQIPPIDGVPQICCANRVTMIVAPALSRGFLMSAKILQHFHNNASIDRFNSHIHQSLLQYIKLQLMRKYYFTEIILRLADLLSCERAQVRLHSGSMNT